MYRSNNPDTWPTYQEVTHEVWRETNLRTKAVVVWEVIRLWLFSATVPTLEVLVQYLNAVGTCTRSSKCEDQHTCCATQLPRQDFQQFTYIFILSPPPLFFINLVIFYLIIFLSQDVFHGTVSQLLTSLSADSALQIVHDCKIRAETLQQTSLWLLYCNW